MAPTVSIAAPRPNGMCSTGYPFKAATPRWSGCILPREDLAGICVSTPTTKAARGAAVRRRPSIRLRLRLATKVVDRPWCSDCATDEYLLIESVEVPRFMRSNSLEISYTCMKCDGFYGHSVGRDTLPLEVLEQFHIQFHIASRSLRSRLDGRRPSPPHSTDSA